ncbi:DUF4333 domain-containing protein [Paraconexibacter algicola]|uniref:DUF4333 domain-containing protein n=1 Tax=Paraconexibacter algicola TaxID=2133960 RepID=A0A2T4UIL2_9ACTN|nr:DUF4333 domain-containing protein [Paraconexibacter algicola]PTL59055.1 hypothetical protein C7Y72_05040 [Paraconexibacter algicola]
MRRPLALLATVALVPLGLAGCGEATVDADKIESEIRTGFESQVPGAKVASIDCDEDIPGTKGSRGACRMTRDGDVRLLVSVTVTSEEDDGRIRWQVTSANIPGSSLEQRAAEALERQVGSAPDLVSCPDRVDLKAGATVRCDVTVDAQTYGATVTFTDADGAFDIKVDDRPRT